MEFIQTILAFLAIISVIVFIHEYGHYIIAKWSGVRIETFSIGFGREILGWNDRTGTRWKISLLPLGGYVKMFGDASEASTPDSKALEEMTEEERAVSFYFKPLWKKAAIVAAGPIANFILAIAIFTGFIFTNGLSTTQPIVGEIMPDTPAAEANLQPGDRVLSVDGEAVSRFGDIPRLIIMNVGEEVTLVIERDGKEQQLQITPRMMEQEDSLGNKIKLPLIGIRSKTLTFENVGIIDALGHAVIHTYDNVIMMFEFLGQMIMGDRSPKDLKGPVGIAKLSGQAAEKGLSTVLWFMALLSANLGIVNLLPIPPLDGGHLLFYLIEGGRGRPLAEKVQEWGYRIGFALILTLMAFTIYNDIRQILVS